MAQDDDVMQQEASRQAYHHVGFRIPLILFIATCLSTFFVGTIFFMPKNLEADLFEGTFLESLRSAANYNGFLTALKAGFEYSLTLMVILVCHEAGHFLQSYRYKVGATLPYFIPVPMPPIGTMGAVIVMEPKMGHRRELFDIGITGPLAGLVPTIIFCIIGIQYSEIRPGVSDLGMPLVFSYLVEWFGEAVPPNCHLALHPVAYAGWVGLLITSLNLIPIGQLDGGHVLYTLIRGKTQFVSTTLLVLSLIGIIKYSLLGWSIMLILLILMGPKHPPTADDDEPLGVVRYILGWLTLAFVVVGFTPIPFHV
jgi:membrane-associated protease RseP (regulator of RpoE activity)